MQSPYQQYLGAIEAATGDKIRMRRYVRLFTIEEFGERGILVQREYVNWLKSQFNLLSRNPNYILGDVLRAPQWGSNLARIMTHGSMMEITGDGESGLVITDDFLCETVRHYARESIIGGGTVKNKPKYYGQSPECNPVQDFWHHLSNFDHFVLTRSATDEETI